MEIKDSISNYRVRNITENDLKEIIQIAEECNLSHWSPKDYKNEIRRADSIYLLIENTKGRKESTAGFIIARLTTSQEAEVYNIAVRKKSRHIGAGKLLLNSAIEKAVELDDTRVVWLEVRESNQSAISFYRKNGFSIIGLRKNFYANPSENAILMKLERFIKLEEENNRAK